MKSLSIHSNAGKVISTLLICISASASAQFYKVSDLREDFQLLGLVGTGKATSEEYAKIGRLLGYIDGIVDAHLLERSRGTKMPKDAYTFCLPENLVNKELHESVKSYLTRHNEKSLDNAPANAIVARAFRESFPCAKK